jgi:colanic acid biosynthesis glycosyl transferase WcaI
MAESVTALPEEPAVDPVKLRDEPRVWFVSAVQQENVESTTHIFARLAEALGEVYPTGILAPPRPASAAPGDAAFGRWFLDRFRRALVGSLRVFAQALREVRPGDVVMVVTNPPMLPVLMSVVSRLRRARLVIVVHDVYPDVLYANGLMPAGSLAGRLLDRLARGALRRADRVIVIGRDMKRRIESKLNGPAGHVVYIPNWADPDIAPRNMSGKDTNRPLVVQYSGNMGLTHPVETLLDCAELLQRDKVHVRFDVFGWGRKQTAFLREVRHRKLTNVTVGERCPRAELGQRLAECDVALILMRPGMSGISVPCRFYNILAAGKPVIVAADVDTEVAMVVQEQGLGWVVEPQDPGALAAAAMDAARRPDELKSMGGLAAELAARKYSFQAALQSYVRVIDECSRC